MRVRSSLVLFCIAFGVTEIAGAADPVDAREKLREVVAFYREQVGYQGAYLWKYSADLQFQEGEEVATRTSGWTQPPGTPSVGEAYLQAWRQSGEECCLDAAREAAYALVRAQLLSGGWSSHFDLGAEGRKQYAYRVDAPNQGKNNRTTFDDNKSQSALLFLMHFDEATRFSDAKVHETVEYALSQMLAAQYPNGAWPQQYDSPPRAEDYPVLKASYPEEWPREFPNVKYTGFYTLNDGNMVRMIETLFEAERIYGRDDCRAAAVRTGEFFLLAQMPDPQPGWAQQYNSRMHPVWARKFEPAAITGGESQGVMDGLLYLYQMTGEKRFLEPIPRALDYYRRSLLDDGRLARFYELHTNKPLYFTKKYELTYDDGDLPTHYGFKVSSKLDRIEREYDKLLKTPQEKLRPATNTARPVKASVKLSKAAEKVIDQLDDRGAWVERGKMEHTDTTLDLISMRTFIQNLDVLSQAAGATEE